MPTIKSILRLFYPDTILLIFVFLLLYMIPYIYPIAMIFYCIVMIRISSVAKGITSPTESLTEKMMSCKLTIKNGLDYCAKCPDGYACASGKGK